MGPTKEKLVDLYHGQSLSIRDIAKRLNVPHPTVASWLYRSGITLRTKTEGCRLAGQRLSPSTRKKMSDLARIQKTGIKQSPELIAKRVASRKGYTHSPETRLKIGRKGRKFTPEQRQRQWAVLAEARKVKPTSIERALSQILETHNFPFSYVGDLSCFIGGRNPDFLQEAQEPRAIEVFGRWWHDPAAGNPKFLQKHSEANVLAHYEEHGYRCLILWEEELKAPEAVVLKIREFCELPLLSEAPAPWWVQ